MEDRPYYGVKYISMLFGVQLQETALTFGCQGCWLCKTYIRELTRIEVRF